MIGGHALPLLFMPHFFQSLLVMMSFVCPLLLVMMAYVVANSWSVVVSADDVLDAEEDFDDEEGDDAHSYADLAAAMGAPEEAESAEEEGLASESELGSDAADNEGGILDVPSDEEEDDADLALSDMNDADSLDDADNDVMSGSGSDHSDQEVDEDVNPFELAEATDSDDDMSTKGTACSLCFFGLMYVPHTETNQVHKQVRHLSMPQRCIGEATESASNKKLSWPTQQENQLVDSHYFLLPNCVFEGIAGTHLK